MERKLFLDSLGKVYATQDAEINCEQVQGMLPSYVDEIVAGGNPSQRLPAVDAHLAQCPDCAQVYDALREVVELEAKGRLPRAQDLLAEITAETHAEAPESVSAAAQ